MPAPLLRQETRADIDGIREVVRAAFGRAGEAELVDGLRASGALTFSAVALKKGRLVGHVAFSPVTIEERHCALALAPVAVAPECQRQGIGSALIRWSLEQCRQLGHGIVLVVGEPEYYRRFGFTAAARFGMSCSFPVPEEVFMLLELFPAAANGCRGKVRYRPEFELV